MTGTTGEPAVLRLAVIDADTGFLTVLARRLGCTVDSVRTELATTEADERAADEAWGRLGLDGRGPVVCLNTGGAFGPAKSWPSAGFGLLCCITSPTRVPGPASPAWRASSLHQAAAHLRPPTRGQPPGPHPDRCAGRSS